MTTLRLGTRRSALALAQSQRVADAVQRVAGARVELVPLVTEGDTSRASLASLGGTGVFATRLREALLAGECDLVVHSLKDLPTAAAPGLALVAVCRREDARDVVVTRGPRLVELATGATVGTGSPRRRAQVLRRNRRVTVHDLRGNVDSRLERVRTGELDAVVLAAAGLARLGFAGEGALCLEEMGLAEWPTAAGQGALAVEARSDAPAGLLGQLASIDHAPTRIAVTAERAALATLEAGCHAPVGIHAGLAGSRLRMRTVVYGADGSARIGSDRTEDVGEGYIRESGDGDGANVAGGADPYARAALIGSATARRLLESGAAGLLSRESLR